MEHRTTTRALAGLALALTAGVTAEAQETLRSLRVSGGLTAGKSVTVAADRPAHFAVFAVGRGLDGNPIQVLTDVSPDAVSSVAPGKRLTVRPLSAAQMLRFAPASEVVVVALASETAPRLDAFVVDGRWANDLLIADSAMADGQQLIASLAGAVFGKDVRYTARLMPVTLESPNTASAGGPGYVNTACSPVYELGGQLKALSGAQGAANVIGSRVGDDARVDGRDTRSAVGAIRLPGCTEFVYHVVPEPTPGPPSHPRPPAAPSTPPTVPQD